MDGLASLLGVGKLTINNPGNIEKTRSGTKWKGEYDCSDPRFACFDTMPDGYRAMFILLRNYINDGFNTITKIINHWAPPTENDTAAYIKNVVQWSGVSANKVIDPDDIDTLEPIVSAMSRMENGVAAVSSQVKEGKELARSRFKEYVQVGAGVLGLLVVAGGIYCIFAFQDKPDKKEK